MTKIDVSKENSLVIKDDSKNDCLNDTTTKKKKRKKRATICTTYCKFEIVRKTARNLGMKEVSYNEAWNVLWTDYSVSIAKIKVLKGYQRVNHFPGMAEICHKALLAKNLNRMARYFPKQYNFFPKTWCFPSEYNDAVEYSKKHLGRTYILKPGAGCRGQGIQLTKNFRCIPPADKLICQLYVSKPFLVDGLKFDLRVYTLITSCEPLKIYVYNEGLARFATAPYRKPAGYNLANCYMHLTNYSVNKYSSTFVSDGECGTKRRISCLNQWLSRNLYDIDEIWYKIDDVIVKTIISALPVIKHSYQVSFPNHDALPACFEILGFDILLDSSLHPYVLEVNHSPSFNTDSKVDEEIKVALLEDTFRLLNLAEMDTQKVLEQDKKRSQIRLQNIIDLQDVEDKLYAVESLWTYEEGQRGNYRLVYPAKGKPLGSKEDPYKEFIEQAGSFNLLVADNAASKAREQVAKIQRDPISQKEQLEQLLKVHSNNNQNKASPDNSSKHTKIEISKSKMAKKDHSTSKPNDVNSNGQHVTAESETKVSDVKSTTKQNRNPAVEKTQRVKAASKLEFSGNEGENKPVNDIRSDINLMIVEDEEQKRNELNNRQGSDFFVKKLYSRLMESGHMPGAFSSTDSNNKHSHIEDVVGTIVPKLPSSDEKTVSGKHSRSTQKSNRKHKYFEEPEVTDLSARVVKRNVNLMKKRMPAKEFSLLFHSRAASEFLKFQKMKLLRKFQDLT